MSEIDFERSWAEYMIVEAAYSAEMDELRQDLIDGVVADRNTFKVRIRDIGTLYGLDRMNDNMQAFNLAIQTVRQRRDG